MWLAASLLTMHAHKMVLASFNRNWPHRHKTLSLHFCSMSVTLVIVIAYWCLDKIWTVKTWTF